MKKIIVIGAGILGATTAYKLAKLGADVTIIDRNDEGQATGAAAGIICPWLAKRRNKAWYQLARNGARIYPELIDELTKDGEIETGYKRVGLLSLHTDESRLLDTEQRVLKRREDAPEIGNITLLDKQKTHELFPLVDEKYQSIHVSGAARVDGAALQGALLRSAKKHGATMIHGDAKLVHTKDQITGVTIDGEIITADQVILATGAWMGELLTPLGIHANIYPQKAQIIHLELPEVETNEWPVIMPPNNQYILPADDHKIIIGATHESKAGFDNRVTVAGVHEILTKALEVAPHLDQATLVETKVGFRPFTSGSLPVIGRLPHFKGLLLANGLGASGLTMGPYIGTQLAKMALDIEPDIDLNDYDIASIIQ